MLPNYFQQTWLMNTLHFTLNMLRLSKHQSPTTGFFLIQELPSLARRTITLYELQIPLFACYFKSTFLIWIFLQRFGTALVPWGQLHLKNKQYATDFEPINKDCECWTCKQYTRAYINCLLGREEVACHLLTLHNIYYQVSYRKLHYLTNGKSHYIACTNELWLHAGGC